jgi:hypothetical protein
VFAGALALDWRERPPLPFDSFVRGVALHDRGYSEHDVDDIESVDRDRWLELQRAGFGEHDDDPIVDLVVSMHVRRLVGHDPQMDAAIPRLCARAGVSVADAEAADRITAVCDGIAFDVCLDGLTELTVDPWPFAHDTLDVLLVGYRADRYPERLDRVVETVRLRPG